MLKFDSKGFLVPNHNIPVSISEFKKVFVDDFDLIQRAHLFDMYTKYTDSLKTLCNLPEVKQWIDGSFTTRIPRPNDIDLITFIDFGIAERYETELQRYKYPLSKDLFGVDAYIVKTYPADHKNNNLYHLDAAYWLTHFSNTRINRFGNKSPKGFVEINI